MPSSDVHIMCCSNEAFAMQASVTLRSAIDNLNSNHRAIIHYLSWNISKESKNKIEQSVLNSRSTIEWRDISGKDFEGLPALKRVSLATFGRFVGLMDEHPGVEKIIYLDCDIVVAGDLSLLVAENISPMPIGAVPSFGRANFHEALGTKVCKRLNLDLDSPFFNAGVFLVDVEKWQHEDLSRQCLQVVKEEQKHKTKFYLGNDQDALNIVLQKKWSALPFRWNVTPFIQSYVARENYLNVSSDAASALQHPMIVHYAGRDKPWLPGCSHPNTALFYYWLDKTAWKEWRPALPMKDRVTELKRSVLTKWRN